MALQVDLPQMTYDSFKAFMKGLAKLYSDVNSNHNFMALFRDLKSIAKRIGRPPLNFYTLYGAYEIADNQIVLAVFNIEMEYPEDTNIPPHMKTVEVSFAEDTTHLHCPIYIRDLLTQPDYITRVEQAYPRIMETLQQEKEQEKRGYKVESTKISQAALCVFDDDIAF